MANNNGLAEGANDRSKLATSFPCRFCAREFRNAQALGGHMNVHRRERNLAKDLVQLQFDDDPHADGCKLRGCNHQHKVVKSTSSIIEDRFVYVPGNRSTSSSASSSPPGHHASTSDLFATSSTRLAYNQSCREIQFLRRDSKGRDCHVISHPAVDLELRLGHRTPDHL